MGLNVLKLYEGDFLKTMLGASCTSAREMELNASEGGMEITFEGDPMQT